MINYIEHKKIDKQKWDACIHKSSNACLFVYSWYLDVVCKDWSALILNDYEAVFPLAIKTKYKISFIYQPFFTRYFGLYSTVKVTEELTNNFFEIISQKYKYIEFCLHEHTTFKSKEYKLSERKFQLINLNMSYKDVEQNYKGDAKRNIKKAIKNNLTVENKIEPSLIIELFKKNKGAELRYLKKQDYDALEKLMLVCIEKKIGYSYSVNDAEKNICAAAFFINYNNRLLFLKGSATKTGKSKGAMYFLIDSVLKQFLGSDVLLDFGGSNVESVASFNKNFGAKDCVYLQVKKNSLPGIVKWISGKS